MLSEKEVLAEMVSLIENAGLLNLSNGVQLGATSWYVKMSDCMESAKAVLAEREGAQTQPPVQPAGNVVDDTISAMITTYREDESGKFKPVRDRMTDAYQVARAQVIAEALDAVSKIDIGKPIGAVNPIGWAAGWNSASHWWREKIKEIRARLAQADKPRTPAERVEVARVKLTGHWAVYQDGLRIADADFIHKHNAERYAAGLRAEING